MAKGRLIMVSLSVAGAVSLVVWLSQAPPNSGLAHHWPDPIDRTGVILRTSLIPVARDWRPDPPYLTQRSPRSEVRPVDGWGNEVRFLADSIGLHLISAGPDGVANTSDDIGSMVMWQAPELRGALSALVESTFDADTTGYTCDWGGAVAQNTAQEWPDYPQPIIWCRVWRDGVAGFLIDVEGTVLETQDWRTDSLRGSEVADSTRSVMDAVYGSAAHCPSPAASEHLTWFTGSYRVHLVYSRGGRFHLVRRLDPTQCPNALVGGERRDGAA